MDVLHDDSQHTQRKVCVVVLTVEPSGVAHHSLDLFDRHDVVVDHLLELFLDESQLLLVLLVLVLDQQEVERQDLVEDLSEDEEVRDVREDLEFTGKLCQLHPGIHNAKVHCIGRLLAGLEFIKQSQLFYLEIGQIDGEEVAVHLEHQLVELEVLSADLLGG